MCLCIGEDQNRGTRDANTKNKLAKTYKKTYYKFIQKKFFFRHELFRHQLLVPSKPDVKEEILLSGTVQRLKKTNKSEVARLISLFNYEQCVWVYFFPKWMDRHNQLRWRHTDNKTLTFAGCVRKVAGMVFLCISLCCFSQQHFIRLNIPLVQVSTVFLHL